MPHGYKASSQEPRATLDAGIILLDRAAGIIGEAGLDLASVRGEAIDTAQRSDGLVKDVADALVIEAIAQVIDALDSAKQGVGDEELESLISAWMSRAEHLIGEDPENGAGSTL